MAIKEIQIHQLPEVDKITNENVFAVEVGTTTYKVTGQTLINFIKTHSEIKNIYIDKELIGVNNGIVPINSNGKIDSQYISYGNVSGTSYEGSSGKLLEDELTVHKQDSSNPHGVDKEQVGLGKVENKSSEDIRNELTYQNIIDALKFVPEVDGTYEQATAYTDKAIADLIGGASETRNTLEELEKAIKESEDVVEALNQAIGTKANEVEFDSHVKDTAVHLSSTDRENITIALEHSKSDHARSDATKTERSTTNGNIKINGTETTVYQHPLSGINAGTYRQVIVDSEGHVTGGNNTTLPLTQGGTGATTAAQALSNLGISATAEELNKLDGATVSVTEINQLKGVTSPVQEQLDGKAQISHGNHIPNVTSDSNGAVMMSDGTNYDWKKLEKQDIVDALGYEPGTGSIVYTSVKGDNETEYRTGEVNITKDNIGLGKVDNTSDNEKSVLSATKLSNARKIGNASFDGTKDITLKETGALDPIGDEFNSSLSYAVGDFCIYNNTLYKCTAAIDTAGEWDESKWEATTVAAELSLGSDNSVTLTRAEYDALSDEEKDSNTTYYISDEDAQSNAFSVPFTSDKYTATNTGDALIEVKTELEETNSNLKVIDTNADNKSSFYTVDGTTIGLPSGYYKVMTVSNFEGTEGYQIATGYYGGNAIDKMFRRTFVNNVYNEWDELATASNLSAPNAGSHNSVYRGKYLGNALTTEQKAQISAGTFNDLYIGDYWTIGGVNYRIAAFDYWLNCGDTQCTKHHVVIVPDTCLYNAQMNTTNTTTGAYIGSNMYTANLASAKTTIENAFGSANILNHRELLANATKATADPTYETGASWYDSTVELMNECMVYGFNIFHNVEVNGAIPTNYTIDKSQLALFRLDPSKICNRVGWWLRDVVSAACFAGIYITGDSTFTPASTSFGVRPVFAIKG